MNPAAFNEAVEVLRLALLKVAEQEQQLTADKAVFASQEAELRDASDRIAELLLQRHSLTHAVRTVTRARRSLLVAACAASFGVGFATGRIA